jgi:hypothetical protein
MAPGFIAGAAKSIPSTLLGGVQAFGKLLPAGMVGGEEEKAGALSLLERGREALAPEGQAQELGNIAGNVGQAMLIPGGIPAQIAGQGALAAAQEGEAGPAAAVSGLTAGALGKILKMAPAAREHAIATFLKLFPEKGQRALSQIASKIAPIAEDLPVGGAKALFRKAEAQRALAGEEVGRVYGGAAPQAVDLAPAATKLTERAERALAESDPQLGKALMSRASELEGQAAPATVQDVFRLRKGLGAQAGRAKVFKPGSAPAEQPVGAQAKRAAYEVVTQRLHEAFPEGEAADAAYSAWKRVSNAMGKTAQHGTSDWLKTVVLPRVIIGAAVGGGAGYGAGSTTTGLVTGAAIGALSYQALWRSVSSKSWMQLSKMMEAGDEAGAASLIASLAGQSLAKNRNEARKSLTAGQGVVAP